MNYRHAYHAGNFADVLKHVVLALAIEHLKLKPAPFRVIDTHAGTGRYDLQGEEALKTGEWRDGIARVLEAPKPAAIEALLAPYLNAVLEGGELRHYPGSPLIVRRLMRPDDRLIANELHPDDAESLSLLFARDKQVKTTCMDGWTALKAFLPPKERRGLILIDPPFEEPGELDRLSTALKEARKRFATGMVLLWYPIKNPAQLVAFERQLTELCSDHLLRVDLFLRAPNDVSLLNGTGLFVVNPPFTLQANLQQLMPFLAETLARGSEPGWRVETYSSAAH